jgi:hypothetical protein
MRAVASSPLSRYDDTACADSRWSEGFARVHPLVALTMTHKNRRGRVRLSNWPPGDEQPSRAAGREMVRNGPAGVPEPLRVVATTASLRPRASGPSPIVRPTGHAAPPERGRRWTL